MTHISRISVFAFIAFFIVGAPTITQAAEQSKAESIAFLLGEIERLQAIIADRMVLSESDNVSEDRSDDFFLRVPDESVFVYGVEKTDIIVETDGGVRQIMVMSDCSGDNDPILGDSQSCKQRTWFIDAETVNGVKSFTVPVQYQSRAAVGEFELDFYACRYDGCVYEKTVNVGYKEAIEFSDQVTIFDRYEWTYEWDDRDYHVQEVLLNFPYKDIKKVELRVYCEEGRLYIATTEDDRATCNNRRRFSNVDYREYETDEQGNTYNLRVESVTEYFDDYPAGSVTMEFKFIHRRNHVVALLNHVPVQLDDLPDEEEVVAEN